MDPEAVEVVGGQAAPPVPDAVYRRAVAATFGLTLLVDEAGRVRALSDAAAALYGGLEAPGTFLVEAPWWDEPGRVGQALDAARGGLFDRFYTRVTRDGRSRTLVVDVQSVEGPEGAPWSLVEARDVTQLLASEHQLHDAVAQLERGRARLEAVLSATPDLVCALDLEGRITHANDAWLRAAHVALGEPVAVGETYLGRGPFDDRWRRALGGEAHRERVRFPLEGGPGALWLDASYAPVRGDDGRVLGAMVVGRDVTGQVEAAQVRLALTGGQAATFVLDPDGGLLSAAPELFVLLSARDARGLDDLFAAVDRPPDAADRVRAVLEAPGSRLDLALTLSDGAAVRLRGLAVGVDGETRLVGVAYPEGGAAEAADARWGDLLDRAGWGGRESEARVDTSRPPSPPPPEGVRARVQALQRTGLLDAAPPAPAFDTLTRLVSAALGVPVSLVSVVDADRQVFVSQVGLDGDLRETPLTHSFCRHVADHRRPLVVDDARESPLVADNGAVADLDVVAYLGVPVAAPDGHVIGALCAIDHRPHAWTADELRLLSSVAEAVTAEVAAVQARTDSPD